jgi:hypothetical protein
MIESQRLKETISIRIFYFQMTFKPNEQDDNNWPQKCNEIHRLLYKISKGIVYRDVYSNVIAEKVGFDEETIMDCIEYLESKGFVTVAHHKPTGINYDLIRITYKGVEEIEKPPLYMQQLKKESDSQLTAENQRSKLQVIQIFISHANEDYDRALKLYHDLENEYGLKPWIDKKSLLPGQKWNTTIIDAIRKSRFFIALLSSNSVNKRGYVQRELKEALDILDEYPESDVFIIPVRLDNCLVLENRLKQLHHVDLFPHWAEGFKKILETIQHYK